MTLVLDASVMIPALVPEPATDKVQRFLGAVRGVVVLSDFAAAEVCSGISRLLRTREITLLTAQQRLQAFDVMRASFFEGASVEPDDVRSAQSIVRRFDLMLKTPDAVHVAIAQRLGGTLVTLDQRLAISARALGLTVDVPA